jgi:aminoglycoside phosphotransferase (APT) family kinase protein
LSPVEIVDTPAEAGALELAPLLVRRPVEAWLDLHGLGSGPVAATRLGEGNSNVTFLLERGGERFVLRRPPRPPLPPSAHDMLREARVQVALERAGARVPHLLAVCDDESVLGVPFYVMEYLEGAVVTSVVPAALDSGDEQRRIGLELVDALTEIHAVDWASCGLEDFGKPTGYLERQIRRFAGLWEVNATRDLPAVEVLGAWLEGHRPESREAAVVHGEYRLGNVMLATERPARVIAVLDWELSTIGDPLADLGYLIATYTDATSPGTPLELSPVTGQGGFPNRAELAERYEERSGRSVSALAWYETLALWKASVFCEAIYGRWLKGELAADHRFASSLEAGVPRLLEVAAETAARA